MSGSAGFFGSGSGCFRFRLPVRSSGVTNFFDLAFVFLFALFCNETWASRMVSREEPDCPSTAPCARSDSPSMTVAGVVVVDVDTAFGDKMLGGGGTVVRLECLAGVVVVDVDILLGDETLGG